MISMGCYTAHPRIAEPADEILHMVQSMQKPLHNP